MRLLANFQHSPIHLDYVIKNLTQLSFALLFFGQLMLNLNYHSKAFVIWRKFEARERLKLGGQTVLCEVECVGFET